MFMLEFVRRAVLNRSSIPLFVIFYGLMQVCQDPMAVPVILKIVTLHVVFRKLGSWVCSYLGLLGSGAEELTAYGSDMLGLISSESYATAVRGTW